MQAAPQAAIQVHLEERHASWRAFDLNVAGADILNFGVDLYGWSLKNVSTSTAAVLDIYDGSDASGIPVFPLIIAASGVSSPWFGPNGVRFQNGVYVNVTTGEVKGSVLYRRHH